jgi:hypothetical protein
MKITSTNPIAYFVNGTRGKLTASNSSNSRETYNFEQIPPTNQWGTEFIIPTVLADNNEAIFARVYSESVNNTLQIKYSNGTTTNHTLSAGFQDIRIDYVNNSAAHAVYVESDNPVGIFLVHSPREITAVGNVSQPGIAWLPPLEQTIGSVLVSPLDFGSRHIYLNMSHDFIIITPTATKNNTTISIDGGQPQNLSLSNKFQWISDNIGGSGYSFGRYRFGTYAPQNNNHTIAWVENPDGMLLLSYGQGSYANYFYTAGASALDLENTHTISGTVSGLPDNEGIEVYYEIGGVRHSVTTTTGGAYTIPDVPDGAEVIIIPSPQTDYNVSPSNITIPSVEGQVTGKDFFYTKIPVLDHSVTISVSENNICSGTSVSFTANSINSGASPSYQWKKNGSSISNANASTYTCTPNHDDIIICEVTSSDAYVTPLTAVSNSITMVVTIATFPSVNISATGN